MTLGQLGRGVKGKFCGRGNFGEKGSADGL
jgi:hypothetical protein